MNKEELAKIIEDEGEFDQFIDTRTNLMCRIIRPFPKGHLCGYVRLPKNHRLEGVDLASSMSDDKLPYRLDVHWGITYSHDMDDDGFWWIGFDCGHAGDLNPANVLVYDFGNHDLFFKHDTYRNKEYVKNECIKLARQVYFIP